MEQGDRRSPGMANRRVAAGQQEGSEVGDAADARLVG